MKKMILLFGTFVAGGYGLCQTNVFPAAGNVGVGTASPAYKLDVLGDVRLQNSGLSANIYGVDETHFIKLRDGGADWTTIGDFGGVRIFTGNHSYTITEKMQIAPNGNVGIGTTSPAYKLDVNGETNISTNAYVHYLPFDIKMRVGADGLQCYNYSMSDFKSLFLNPAGGNVGIGTKTPAYKLDVNGDSRFSRGVGSELIVQTPSTDVRLYTAGTPLCVPDANVGIGTVTPGAYRLAVEGTVGARKVKVTQEVWADYVFDSSYQLPSLSHVESFIKENKHLPEVPSAAEVKKEGLDLGDNQVLLLKKIEELTLYIIQQNKKMEIMERRLAEVETKQSN
ncbi:hypothetical protein [Filimonas effusa]|uniref:Uncharacterized protein n=1 Tax=Filimonas effusa TaxID=2508721 RepID=A0A4Q1D3A6_9BACT|nr:hypothetical protein [Filimonas effusa]RXK82892.1 hypothetical protein ESB13_12240 [Filimonas effusa]